MPQTPKRVFDAAVDDERVFEFTGGERSFDPSGLSVTPRREDRSMVALLHDHPNPSTPVPPAPLRLVASRRPPAAPAPAPLAVVLAVAAAVLALGLGGLRLAQGAPPTTSWVDLAQRSVADAANGAAPGGLVLVVQPGDTLWSIAQRLDPGRDPRPLVDALARANGGTALQAGQRIVVPARSAAGG
jgi:hypothetical protein